MSDEMKDYVDNFRANLPAGITYDSDIARYFCNNRRFFNEWEVSRYLAYIKKFGFSVIPEALFENGEQGAWYDPSDLTTLFQDAAGTTPVTADGDPVGYMGDKSGNGNHATQATSAARPVYRTDGTLYWLEFDGVDDRFSISGLTASAGPVTAVSGFLVNNDQSLQYILDVESGRLVLCGRANTGGQSGLFDGAAFRETATNSNVNYVISGLYYSNGAVRINGTEEVTFSMTELGLGGSVNLGSRFGSSDNLLGGRIYGLTVIAKELPSQELNSLEVYMAQKSEVTL